MRGADLVEFRKLADFALHQRAPRFVLDLVFRAEIEERLLAQARVEFDLVDGWNDRCGGEQIFQMMDHEIADTNRARAFFGVNLFEHTPRVFVFAGHGPVNQVQIDIIHAELFQRSVERF